MLVPAGSAFGGSPCGRAPGGRSFTLPRQNCLLCIVLAALFAVARVAAAQPERIYLSPGYMALTPFSTQQFSVIAVDSAGSESDYVGPVTWQVQGTAGSITPDGLFSAGQTAGYYSAAVTATIPGGLVAKATVQVFPAQLSAGYFLSRVWGNYARVSSTLTLGCRGRQCRGASTLGQARHRVQVFSPEFEFLFEFGTPGLAAQSLYWPCGLSIGADGTIYVADRWNYRIATFSDAGVFSGSIGSHGEQEGQFGIISSVVVSADGNVYALDCSLLRMQVFDSQGAFAAAWSLAPGTAGDRFALSGAGSVYVLDTVGHKVKHYTLSGVPGVQWNVWGSYIETGPQQEVLVSTSSGICRFSPTGQQLGTIPTTGKKAFATDNAGNLYQQDDDGNIARMSLDGTVTGRLLRDTGQGRLYGPDGVDVGPDGNIYVSSGNEVQVFAPDGTFVRRWPAVFPGVSTRYAIDLACDSLGHVYLAVNDDGLILKCDLWGNLLGSFGSLGTGPGQFQYPYAVAVDKQGDVYVAEKHSYRIQKFSPAGELGTAVRKSRLCPAGPKCLLPGRRFRWECLFRRCHQPPGPEVWTHRGVDTVLGNPAHVTFPPASAESRASMWTVTGTYGWPTGSTTGCRSSRSRARSSASGEVVGRGLGPVLAGKWYCGRWTGRVYIVDRMQGRIQVLARPLEHPTCGAARMGSLAGSQVTIRGQVVTASVTDLGDCFYIESPDRSGGIKVLSSLPVQRGAIVTVQGILTVKDGEAAIQLTGMAATGRSDLAPLDMRCCDVGGGACGVQTALWACRGAGSDPGPMQGLTNVGLLVRVAGRVTHVSPEGRRFNLDDGSGAPLVCVAPAGVELPSVGGTVRVTGISAAEIREGRPAPLLRLRGVGDIAPL